MRENKRPARESGVIPTDSVATEEDPSGAATTHEQIARRAYELFLARGVTHGDAVEDWLQAERELRTTGREGGNE